MFQDITVNDTKFFKAGLVLLSCFLTLGCSTPNVKYITREEVKKYTNDSPQFTSVSSESKVAKVKKPMSLGALRITSKYAEEGDPGQLIMLQRKRGVYIAETELMSSTKTRYFLSVGIDPRNQRPALGFRIEF